MDCIYRCNLIRKTSMNTYIDLIKKMLKGGLDASEKILLSEAEPMKKILSAQWNENSEWYKQDKVNPNEIWNKITAACRKTAATGNNGEKKKIRFSLRYSIAAAVAIVLLGVWIVKMTTDSYITISAPIGQRLAWVLPDSSTIWLNGESKIKYPKKFLDNRMVELTGEAYFSVVKRTNSPFKVHLQEACVEVKGTEFNIQLNPAEVLVTLFTGKIVFSTEAELQPVEMKPAEQLVYNRISHDVNLSKIDPEEYDWRKDVYHFQNKPFGELLQFINRTYKVNIVTKDNAIEKELFSGKIRKSETLSDVLNKICISFDLQQKKEDNQRIVLY